jgi:uncharacterized protein
MKRELPRMELDLVHFDDRETFSFHEGFSVPTEEGGTAQCDARVTGTVVRMGSRIVLDAHVDCKINVACSRCLGEFDLPVDARFGLIFHRGDRAHLPEDVDVDDDFILLTEASEKLYDIFPRVREAVILELPIRFLCREECRGLCSRCGANLNEGDCNCEAESGDPRWGPLKKLLRKDRDG